MQDAEDCVAERLCLDDLTAAEEQLFLLQLPSTLPVAAPAAKEQRTQQAGRRKGAAAAAAGEGFGEAKGLRSGGLEGASISRVPPGKLGKLLVFESGKVKLQIGDVLLDVGSGMPCLARQEVAAVNHEAGHLVLLGDVTQRVVVSPNVWQLMGKEEVGNWERAEGCMTTGGWVQQLQEQEGHGGEDGVGGWGEDGVGHGRGGAVAGARGGGREAAGAAKAAADNRLSLRSQQHGHDVNGGLEDGSDDVVAMDMDGGQEAEEKMANGVGSSGVNGTGEGSSKVKQQQQQVVQQQQQEKEQQQGVVDGGGIGSRPAQVDLLGLPLPAAGGVARTKSKFKPKATVKKET